MADAALAGVAAPEAFVIISFVDLELARTKRKRPEYSRRQLASRLNRLPSVQRICAAFQSGGLATARAAATAPAAEPQSVWWCESRAAFEQALAGIYQRLMRSPRPHDAYEHGTCGPLVWVTLWRD